MTGLNRGDIYLVSLDPTKGHEQAGYRPVLIISPAAFNRVTKTPIVLPITNGGTFARKLGFSVEISGIATTGIVRCDQLRSIDITARSGRKIDELPSHLVDEVLARLITIFE